MIIFRNQQGFSLVELIIVMAIIVIVSALALTNFRTSSRSKTAQKQVASTILSDVRSMQSMALSGSNVNGAIVCGFGIHYDSPSSYTLYAGRPAGTGDCSAANRNFEPGPTGDSVIETKHMQNENIQFAAGFLDVFFESPHPTTFIDNSTTVSTTTLILRTKGGICRVDDCTKIVIKRSGKIDLDP